MGGKNKSLFRKVLEGLFLLALVRGIFYALAERDIHPDLWVARLIDSAATVASGSTQAVGWILAGLCGLGLVILLERYFWPWWAVREQVRPATHEPRHHATFEVKTGGKITAKDSQIPGDLPFTLGRAETGGLIKMDGVKFVYASSTDSGDWLPLDRAAEIAWSALQGTAFADELERMEGSPKNIRNTLAYQFVAKGYAYGKKWPSTEFTRVENGRLLNVMNDGRSLCYNGQTEPIITDAVVKPSDVDEYVRVMLDQNRRI